MSAKRRRGAGPPSTPASRVLSEGESSVLDLVDNLLERGVLADGELVLGLADVDLIYVRLSTILAAADKVLPWIPRPRRKRRR